MEAVREEEVKLQGVTIRMIRYDVIYLRALKSWQKGQLSLVHGTETKN